MCVSVLSFIPSYALRPRNIGGAYGLNTTLKNGYNCGFGKIFRLVAKISFLIIVHISNINIPIIHN